MEDKFITREYSATGEKTVTRDRTDKSFSYNGKARQKDAEPKGNGFVRFLKFAFVKNIGLKIAAILTAAVMWALIVGLGPVVL